MNVYLGGKKLRIDPTHSVGKGGEADVFDIGGGRALKLFKGPDHPDLEGDPLLQQAARERIEEQQRKLRAFPRSLPPRVVRPEELVTNGDGSRILGYTMRLLAGAEVLFKLGERTSRANGITADTVVDVLRDLRASVEAVHRAGLVIGDFNDLNVLVLGNQAYLIDADSFQFGAFLCRAFTERFADPLLCDPRASRPVLVRPHNASSDWYAYTVMLMRSLLFVDPYGGVFKPGPAAAKVGPAARPLHRITVFHEAVRYPKPALHWDVLPDDLLQHFHLVFEKDRRGEFPSRLLDELRFTKCSLCGREHARAVCPWCSARNEAAVSHVTAVTGDVWASSVYRTRGTILAATVENGTLRVLAHEDGLLKREDGSIVTAGDWDPRTRFALSGRRTLVARDGLLVTFAPGQPQARAALDGAQGQPVFAGNAQHAYWIEAGRLVRDGRPGSERVGDVLAGQTRIWVGATFGFGFYRAGDLYVSFVFDAEARGLNDGVRVPPLPGQLVDATCAFAAERCWFLASLQDRGRAINRCVVIRRDGTIEAAAETEAGDGSWLSDIHGRCAAGAFLLAPTDEGIVRVEVENGRIVKTREFPDTEPFLDGGCRLLAGSDGLYLVDRQEVRRLTLGSRP